jgi:hypothetical protein
MLAERTKLIVILCLSLCFVAMACVFGFTRITSLLNMMQIGSSGQAPVRSLRITLEESQREQLFDQFRNFADKHGFQFHISDYGTGGEDYLIEMSRNDINIDASIIHPDPKIVSIGFYARYPGYPVDEKTVDDLLNDLKSFIREIPNVTITEEK